MKYANTGYALAGEIIRRLSGKNLSQFAREKIFDPLGMKNTFIIVPDDVVPRIVRRSDSDPRKGVNTKMLKCPSAAGGAYSNTLDMAIFAQMFLNKGTYNGKRILSQRAAELMTQNQISGIPAVWRDISFPEGSWSYGWGIKGNKIDDNGTYRSSSSYCHTGFGGALLIVDLVYDLVLVNFSLHDENSWKTKSLLTNLVISAIEK